MIKPEQDGQQDGKRNCQEDVSDAYVPEIDKPAAIGGRKEGCRW